MSNFRFGIPIASAIAALIPLAACVDESPWGSTSNETGTISLSLSADFDFDTSNPVFSRSEDGDEKTVELANYIDLPDLDEFEILLVSKSNNSDAPIYIGTYADFKSILEKSYELSSGQYTITASYGDPDSQGFDKPYFEASSTFSVLPNRTTEIALTAELKKSMVKVAYTEEFKDYMKSYTAKLTAGSSSIEFSGENEDKAAFILPDEASIVVKFTTNHTNQQAEVKIGDFAPIAKTLHLITFGLAENENGFATLTVNLDDSLTDEEMTVDITDDLYTTPAPVITTVGFESGVTYDAATCKSADGLDLTGYQMTVVAKGGIKEAILGVEGATPFGGSDKVDLHSTTESAMAAYGVVAKGFYNQGADACLATLDLSGLVANLSSQEGEYTIYLTVTDHNSQTCDPVSLKINSYNISISEATSDDGASLIEAVDYGVSTAKVTLDYNGANPSDVTFMVDGEQAAYNASEIVEVSTRAFDTKRYTYTLTLPASASLHSKIDVKAYYNYKGSSDTALASFTIPVTIPEYSISEVDAFAHYAYLKVTTTNSEGLSVVMDNIELRLNGSGASCTKTTENGYGVLTVTGLSSSSTSGTSYTVTSSITNGDIWNDAKFSGNLNSFTTEVQTAIPNGDFSKTEQTISQDLQVGGQYDVNMSLTGSHHYYTISSSYSRELPAEWATINEKTAYGNSSNMNTWFVVPSSWVESEQGYMRNVGYNHNGTTPSASGGYGNRTYYCENSPSNDQLVHAAGELFLGEYSYKGEDNRNEGIYFASRPNCISFYYKYSLESVEKQADQGYAYIEILDSNEKTIASNKYIISIDPGDGTKTINLNYDKFGSKAVKLKISFKSSNQDVPPIHIPTDAELDEGTTLGNKTISANSYHAVATGSEFLIDNVTAHYESAPSVSSAPRRNCTKKRK